jgi:two-component system chemotaxis response regulator CheB
MVLGGLDSSVTQPIAVVLHRHPSGGGQLLKGLQRSTTLEVLEVEDKQPMRSGVFLAPADYHLLVEPGWFSLSIDGPVCHARPSVDVLFESAAQAYGSRTVGVILTGSNRDGAHGVGAIRDCGGVVVAEDPDRAEASQMPRAALEAGAELVPLERMGAFLKELLKGRLP